jgi:hypothetical protein
MRALICTAAVLAIAASPGVAHAQSSSTPLLDAGRREVTRVATAKQSQAGQSTQQPAAQRPWPARHPIVLGTLAGTGVGLGALAVQGCGSSDYTCTGLVAFFGGTGAGLGALAGSVAALFLR